MNKEMIKGGYVAGLVIPFWLAIGVAVTAWLYPGYSHVHQAMSALGAQGAPTQWLSPMLNNYPLGILFVVFGLAIFASFKSSKWARLTGVLIALHGIASLATGYFSCDLGCGLERPSPTQNIHNLAGLAMFLTLVLASAIWIFLAKPLLARKGFAYFSLICTAVAIAVLPLMGQALEAGTGFGLYQRINYGASVIWVGGLALVLLARNKVQS